MREYLYNLVEEGTVCDGKPESIEAHPKHHIIRRVIAVALAAAVEESDHSLSAEHHAAATQTEPLSCTPHQMLGENQKI